MIIHKANQQNLHYSSIQTLDQRVGWIHFHHSIHHYFLKTWLHNCSLLMAVLFYFYRVCCPCKGINFHCPRSTSFHGTANSVQDSVIISWKNIFYTLFMSCLPTISRHETHTLLLNVTQMCYMFWRNDLCKLYNTLCTFEEEWKTSNKYSFGVKVISSRSVVFAWVNFWAYCTPLSVFTWLQPSKHNRLRKWRSHMSLHLPGFLNTQEVLRDALNALPGHLF